MHFDCINLLRIKIYNNKYKINILIIQAKIAQNYIYHANRLANLYYF